MPEQETRILNEQLSPLPSGISIFDGLDVSSLATAQSGRPISESGQIVEGDMSISKYPGSRNGRMINEGSLREVASVWPDVLNGFAYLNYRYFNGEVPQEVTIDDLGNMVNMAINIPIYLINKGEDPLPVEGGVPTFVAGMRKSALGLDVFVRHMKKFYPDVEVIKPDDVYRISESEGGLVGDKISQDLVCAAPAQMITRASEAIIEGNGDASASALASLIVDWESFVKVSMAATSARDVFNDFALNIALRLSDQLGEIAKRDITLKEVRDAVRIKKLIEASEITLIGIFDILQGQFNNGLGRDNALAPKPTVEDFHRRFPHFDIAPIAKSIINVFG